MTKILVHVVTWNSAATIENCLNAVLETARWCHGVEYQIVVTDNASTDDTTSIVERFFDRGVQLRTNQANLGFSAAHNQGFAIAVKEGYSHVLVLNPDVALFHETMSRLLDAFAGDERTGTSTPKLLRADKDLRLPHPRMIDAAGMYLTTSLRHLDRGSGELDNNQYEQARFVFGGTGACLLVSVACVQATAFPADREDSAIFSIYPELRAGAAERLQVFDEAFFAYREDADFAWRCRRLGWRCAYVPSAVAGHVRVVTPERREYLHPVINLLGVRNRFLLQLNNWSLTCGLVTFVRGVVGRNIVVIAGVLLRERSSLPAFQHLSRLAARSLRMRRSIRVRSGFRQGLSLRNLNED